MVIKNLNQLKKALKPGVRYEVIAHQKSGYAGQLREVNISNTVGVYCFIADDENAELSKVNGGRGNFLGWSKAPCWKFSDGVCHLYKSDSPHTNENLIMSFRIVA